MFISEVKVLQRKNLGNYEHKEVGVTVALSESDDAEMALSQATSFISLALNEVKPEVPKPSYSAPVVEVVTQEEEKPAAPAPKKTAKKAVKKPAVVVTEDGPEEEFVTKDQVNAKLIEVAKKFKSKDKAVAILKEFGDVEDLGSLDSSKYGLLIHRCEEVLNA